MAGDEQNSSLYEVLDKHQFKFYKYYHVLFELGLKPNEVHTLSIILSFNKAGQIYNGSYSFLCKKLNITSKTALSALNSLIDKGFIKKQASKGGKASIYFVNEKLLRDIFLNSVKTPQLNSVKTPQLNSGETPLLTDDKNMVNYGEIPRKQCKNSTVNSGETPHNKNIYKNNYKINIDTQLKIADSSSLEKDKKSSFKKKKRGTYTEKDYITDIEAYTNNEELRKDLLEFYEMRKAKKKAINTPGITKRLLKKLDELSNGDIEIKKAIVDKATRTAWIDFYQLNNSDLTLVKNKIGGNTNITPEQQKALEAPSIPPIVKDIQEKAEKGEPLTSDEKDLLSIYGHGNKSNS